MKAYFIVANSYGNIVGSECYDMDAKGKVLHQNPLTSGARRIRLSRAEVEYLESTLGRYRVTSDEPFVYAEKPKAEFVLSAGEFLADGVATVEISVSGISLPCLVAANGTMLPFEPETPFTIGPTTIANLEWRFQIIDGRYYVPLPDAVVYSREP